MPAGNRSHRILRLQALNLSRNRLVEWPLPKLPLLNLAQLDVSGNPGIVGIPADGLDCCAASLQLLDLSGIARFPT